MKIISTYQYRDLKVHLIIDVHLHTENLLSINVDKGSKRYEVIKNYSCELTDPTITVDSKCVLGGFSLEIFEAGPELQDYVLKLEINSDANSAIVRYGGDSNVTSNFKFD